MSIAIIIVILVVIMPVGILMSFGALAGIMGFLLNDEVDARHKGSELYDAWS